MLQFLNQIILKYICWSLHNVRIEIKVWPNAKTAIKNKKIEKIYKSKISNKNRRQQLENWKLAVEKV